MTVMCHLSALGVPLLELLECTFFAAGSTGFWWGHAGMVV